jgi:DNA polymerase-3 subunit delta'
MTVGEDGQQPLPWLGPALSAALAAWRGHALLLHGAPGLGTLPLALSLAQAALCEANDRGAGLAPPCGRCGSCRLVQSRVHPDLLVLLPEQLRREHDWPLRDDKPDADDSRRKPSRQIRVEEVRAVIDWVQRTSGRGRGKVVVLHPADTMNATAASALLKTLEEPPAGTRLVLSAADPATLLPTVRSRCQIVRVPLPQAEPAARWLAGQGVAKPEVLLAACAGRPLEALELHAAGLDAAAWAALPAAVARGQGAAVAGMGAPRLIDTLHKLCHDALAVASGAAPCYFPPGSVPPGADVGALLAWQRTLARVARHDDHPWHEALLADTLVAAAHAAWSTPAAAARGGAPSQRQPG